MGRNVAFHHLLLSNLTTGFIAVGIYGNSGRQSVPVAATDSEPDHVRKSVSNDHVYSSLHLQL